MDMEKHSTGYEYTVVALNFFIVGFVALDRILIANLFPWVMPALKIDFTKAGLIMAILSLTWSVSAIVFGGVSDKVGRKIIIIPATIVFSLMSWMSGMVTSLGQLLGIRAFMGVAEGAYYPTAIATVAEESKPREACHKHRNHVIGLQHSRHDHMPHLRHVCCRALGLAHRTLPYSHPGHHPCPPVLEVCKRARLHCGEETGKKGWHGQGPNGIG